MGFEQVVGRWRRRRQLLGLRAAIRWVPGESWDRLRRGLGKPVWDRVAKKDRTVLHVMPGRDPIRLLALLEDTTGLPVERMTVVARSYRAYLQQARYPRGCYGPQDDPASTFHEKTLEHHVGFRLLDLKKDEVFLDVASNLSPVPEIAARLFQCRSLRQDLGYPEGLHGDQLGGPASKIPLEDASVDAMTLHCSFEHFEGNEDTAFIREAARILRPGGRLVILPLYLAGEHTLVTNRLRGGPRLDDPGVELRLRVRQRTSRFSRFYHPARLRDRVLQVTADLEPRLLFLENPEAISPACYLKFILMMTRR